MPKIVFFFAGTGDSAKNYKESNKLLRLDDDVIQVYVSGCQHQNVGGGYLFPNLDILGDKIFKAFDKNTINLKTLQEEFGDALEIVNPLIPEDNSVVIESIGLEGFSRGAVATFAVAKNIDDLNIPIHMMANQPVPGEESEKRMLLPSFYQQYHDLSQCKNIKSAITMLASHHLRNDVVHNLFFKQMIAKFPQKTVTNTFLIPYQSHFESKEQNLESLHLGQFFKQAEFGYSNRDFEKPMISIYKEMIQWKKPENILLEDEDEDNIEVYKALREERKKTQPCGIYSFTPWAFSQAILGSDKPIQKDLYYFKAVQEVAKECLEKFGMDNSACSDEQAQAIMAIDQSNLDNKENLYGFVLNSNNTLAKNFIDIINCAHEMTDYIYVQTLETGIITDKSEKIKTHSPIYMGKIIQSTYEFLMTENPSDVQKSQYVQKIQDAENEFRKEALSIPRGLMNKIFLIIASKIAKILHLTQFFGKTHSEKLIGTVTQSIPEKFLAVKVKLKENKNESKKSEELEESNSRKNSRV